VEKLTIGTTGSHRKPFTLPLSLVTYTQAILARKRSGKSYTGSVEAEEMLKAKQQIAVIDPTSAWWGLRSSADGRSAGFDIIVFGGDHADAPLDYRAGKAMATALVEHGFSAIFDIGNFHTEEQVQFVMDLCSELLRINRNAMHLFMDEADTFAPQRGSKLQIKCLGAVSRLVKQGGIKGVGFTMISQRSASLSWDVLSQVDILTVLRMSAPHDLRPVQNWLQSETTKEFAAQVYAEQPSLPVGVAFVASAPLGIAQRVEIRKRETFNSGATPKPGERAIVPKILAQIDIAKLGQKIADSVKRAREESPEFLKQRIAALEKEVAKGGKPSMELQKHIKDLEEKAALYDQAKVDLEAAQQQAESVKAKLTSVGNILGSMKELCDRGLAALATEGVVKPVPSKQPPTRYLATPIAPIVQPVHAAPVPRRAPSAPPPVDGELKLRGKSMAMLAACVGMYPAGLTPAQVAMQAGMKRSSGTFDDYKSLLKRSGCVQFVDGLWYATEEGLRRLDTTAPSPPTTTEEALALWMPKLRGKSKVLLEVLVAQRGQPLVYEKLAELAGMQRSGTFDDYLSLLRSAGLITTGAGTARANAEVLFL